MVECPWCNEFFLGHEPVKQLDRHMREECPERPEVKTPTKEQEKTASDPQPTSKLSPKHAEPHV